MQLPSRLLECNYLITLYLVDLNQQFNPGKYLLWSPLSETISSNKVILLIYCSPKLSDFDTISLDIFRITNHSDQGTCIDLISGTHKVIRSKVNFFHLEAPVTNSFQALCRLSVSVFLRSTR